MWFRYSERKMADLGLHCLPITLLEVSRLQRVKAKNIQITSCRAVEIPCPMFHFPEDMKEISIYLSWDKDFIALAKKSIQIIRYIFFLFLKENICCGYSLEAPHWGASD